MTMSDPIAADIDPLKDGQHRPNPLLPIPMLKGLTPYSNQRGNLPLTAPHLRHQDSGYLAVNRSLVSGLGQSIA